MWLRKFKRFLYNGSVLCVVKFFSLSVCCFLFRPVGSKIDREGILREREIKRERNKERDSAVGIIDNIILLIDIVIGGI